MLDQRTRSVLRAPYRTALDCNLTYPWLPADDSVTPWSSSPCLGLFSGNPAAPCPAPDPSRTVEGIAPYPGQARCLALGFWPEYLRRLYVKGGQRPFPKETRSALDIEGKHVTIQRPSPDLTSSVSGLLCVTARVPAGRAGTDAGLRAGMESPSLLKLTPPSEN